MTWRNKADASSIVGLKMTQKKIFVLANSIKKQQRCVAGIEIVKGLGGKEDWGEWIRPVTHHDEGAIRLSECRLQDGAAPLPFDVIQIPLTARENNPTQPENWYIQPSGQWSKITVWSKNEAQKLIERPKSLWWEPGAKKQDRVTPQYLLSQKKHQSLYLVKPVNFQFFVEDYNWDGKDKKRVRAIFSYNGQNYNFSMTDPLARQKHFPTFPNVQSGAVTPKGSEEILICVSLTPELSGQHYKIVATVIES
jgi:hypothetical protein